MSNLKSVCLIVAFAYLVQLSFGIPITEIRESSNDVVDEIIQKLRLLKQQGEGNDQFGNEFVVMEMSFGAGKSLMWCLKAEARL